MDFRSNLEYLVGIFPAVDLFRFDFVNLYSDIVYMSYAYPMMDLYQLGSVYMDIGFVWLGIGSVWLGIGSVTTKVIDRIVLGVDGLDSPLVGNDFLINDLHAVWVPPFDLMPKAVMFECSNLVVLSVGNSHEALTESVNFV